MEIDPRHHHETVVDIRKFNEEKQVIARHDHDTTTDNSDNERTSDSRQQRRPSEGKKFLKYDEAGPKIKRARTHYLSSVPMRHRIAATIADTVGANHTDRNDENVNALRRYASNPDHVWPKKLHLYELNPCIARLPRHYRDNKTWRVLFGENSKLPYYVASYRVTHWNNCHDESTQLKLLGGSWDNRNKMEKTDYLGISLMDIDLNVLVDTTVDLKGIQNRNDRAPSFVVYDDFRLLNMDETLYLTSKTFIAPIQLSLTTRDVTATFSTTRTLVEEEERKVPDNYLEIPPAFDIDDRIPSGGGEGEGEGAGKKDTALRIWIRRFSSCPVGPSDNPIDRTKRAASSKNLLYFGVNTTGDGTTARAVWHPRHNPNDVRRVDLDEPCNRDVRPGEEQTRFRVPWPTPLQPILSLETIERKLYPNHTRDQLFHEDRGSACCTRIRTETLRSVFRNEHHPPKPERSGPEVHRSSSTTTTDPYTNTTVTASSVYEILNDPSIDEELLVAIVHPKTRYPGWYLPEGIVPNIYLSRFIAFLPREPYTILVRSGMFCLGYPVRGMDDDDDDDDKTTLPAGNNPLEFLTTNRLKFANETYECPRIHFAMGMADAPRPEELAQGDSDGRPGRDHEPSVIVSYGVSDCLSRFVEIPKSEIVRLLSGGF